MLSGEELKLCIEEIEEDLETGTLGAQPYFDRVKEYIVELQELLLSSEARHEEAVKSYKAANADLNQQFIDMRNQRNRHEERCMGLEKEGGRDE